MAEDIKFTYDRFLTEKGNANRYILEPVDRSRWWIAIRSSSSSKNPMSGSQCASLSVEYVDHRPGGGAAIRRSEETGDGHRHRSVRPEHEPNVKAVFTRHPDYFRDGQPYVDGVEWLSIPDESTGLAMYRTGQIDCAPAGRVGCAATGSRGAQEDPSPPALSGYSPL